jgi:hypothetical protein
LALLPHAELTLTPGATMSGFILPSTQGPRLLKSATELPEESSVAPTDITFFAVAGGSMVPAPEPELPAEKHTVRDWLPDWSFLASRTM